VRELKRRFREGVRPLALLLIRLGVTANALTVGGLFLTFIAAIVAATVSVPLGGALYLLFTALDFLDGAVARASGTANDFGAFLDSVLDRHAEAAMFAALVYVYAARQEPLAAAGTVAALAGSFLVSYARARAEGLGYDCEVGWLQRPERIVLLGAGMILEAFVPVLQLIIWLLAIFTNVTAIQRMLHVSRLSRERAAK
jgi:CDP-diacylglycerol--glycerol-3-phosphate 3-phosphatidyltransferase